MEPLDPKIIDLMSRAASSLTGKSVNVYHRSPLTEKTAGDVFLAPGGYMINLLPSQTLSQLYQTLLHEVGHLHYGHVKDEEPLFLPAEIIAVLESGEALGEWPDEDRLKHSEKPEEIEAESFVQAIDHYAKLKAFDRFAGDDSIENRLRVLANTRILEIPNQQ